MIRSRATNLLLANKLEVIPQVRRETLTCLVKQTVAPGDEEQEENDDEQQESDDEQQESDDEQQENDDEQQENDDDESDSSQELAPIVLGPILLASQQAILSKMANRDLNFFSRLFEVFGMPDKRMDGRP